MNHLFLVNETPTTVDLHNHSIFSSDGEKTPSEIYEIALQSGMRVISVTDHNNVDFYHSPQFYKLGQQVKIISGIEIDCVYEGINMHLLGYFIDVTDPAFAVIRDNYNQQEKDNGVLKVKKIKTILPVEFDEQDFLTRFADKIITGEDIAEAIFKQQANHEIDAIKPYLSGGHRSDNPALNFYWDFFAQNKPAHTPLQLPTLAEAVATITQAGGIAVIAHPGQNFRGKESMVEAMIKENQDIQGIETFNNYHSDAQSQYFVKLATEYNRKITIGSDYHGHHKPNIAMGMSNYSKVIPC